MVYRVSDAKTGVEIARAKTGHLYYNIQQQKVTAVPQDFKKVFKQKTGSDWI
jgi:acyl-CoA thioesterase FadM